MERLIDCSSRTETGALLVSSVLPVLPAPVQSDVVGNSVLTTGLKLVRRFLLRSKFVASSQTAATNFDFRLKITNFIRKTLCVCVVAACLYKLVFVDLLKELLLLQESLTSLRQQLVKTLNCLLLLLLMETC